MIAADIMSRMPVSINKSAMLAEAVRLMSDHRISGLPVVEEADGVVGMLTEGDLLRRVEIGSNGEAAGWFARFFMPGRLAQDYVHTHARHVSELMTLGVISVTEDVALPEVVRLMQRKRIKRLPVLRDMKLVGIVSRSDLVRALGAVLAGIAGSADDATIRQSIVASMGRQPWVECPIDITVQDGQVLLEGYVFDLRQRRAMSVLAETAPGVKSVDNRLICVEPMSGLIIDDPKAEADVSASRVQAPS
jgi:CBS domain-containing protein